MPHSQAQLRLLLDTAYGGFYTIAKDGTTLLCNKGFLDMLGFAGEADVLGRKLHDVIHHTHPDGSHYPVQDCPIYKCANFGEPAHVDTESFYRQDGTAVPVEYWVYPILKDGLPDGAVCTFVEITERRKAEALQYTLSHELAHRIKNTLSMVQAIVHQSLKNTQSVDVARLAIGERLTALARAHDLLTQRSWLAVSIVDLVNATIAPHVDSTLRIKVSGPAIEIAAAPALSLAMALHELATNAAKYGALSNDSGVVELSWQTVGGEPSSRFCMEWREIGGPEVTIPTTKGFGTRLVAGSFGSDFGGEAKLLYKPAGLEWVLEAPLTGVKNA